jgi:hypothetical protein
MKRRFLLGPTRSYITRIQGQLESEVRESLETAVEDDEEDIVWRIVVCEV